MTKKVTAAIAGIAEDAREPIKTPQAVFDEAEQRWVSDAEVSESRARRVHRPPQGRTRAGRRRVKRSSHSPPTAPQARVIAAYRHHAFITNTPGIVEADQLHRDHAIVEQVIAELDGTGPWRTSHRASTPQTPPGSPSR